jgi:predicted nucleotidyltransferase
MAREKVILQRDPAPVAYPPERFRLLASLREEAVPVLTCLGAGGVYGSLARGDVHKGSDIDIVVTSPPPAFGLELALEEGGFQVTHRELVMASPNSPPKGHLEIGEGRVVSFPLLPMKRREEEFYFFGGYLGLKGLEEGMRVPGVDKRLLLIEPTDDGHLESGIVGDESGVARLLGIGRDVVDERVRVLTRRDSVGRTGVYLRETLAPDEAFEGRLHDLASRDSALKRQVRTRTG